MEALDGGAVSYEQGTPVSFGMLLHARQLVGVFRKSIFKRFVNFCKYEPTKWLQERPNGSRNNPEMPPRRALRGNRINF